MACKSDPKRRRRRRIVKRGRELVFKITAFTPPSDYCVGFNETQPPPEQRPQPLITHARSLASYTLSFSASFFQDHSLNERETSQEPKRKKDENGTSTYAVQNCPPTPPPGAVARGAKLLTSLPRFFQKQREPSLRVAAVGRERERQEVQIVQQREGRVGET